MPKDDEEDSVELLRQIRDLLVLQLRQSGVHPAIIGKFIGNVAEKTVRNRYPIGQIRETEGNNL